MSSSSSTSRNQLQMTCAQVREGVKLCDCDVPTKEHACWKITNPGRRFWNCQNSLIGYLHTRLKKCNFFEWKDAEHEEGYCKNILYSLKQKLDAKEDLFEMKNLRIKIVEVEFLMSQEKCKVTKSEKDISDLRKAIGRYMMIVTLLFNGLVFYVLKLGSDYS
ncbi:unnamed protein product [Lactuca saligna]|uniref:GRF-type domain-containing protein n=1 Tax=Lactuca saligna TaxID=75948 RepID=A0AA35Y917_LACSI|nr:unnamed protein product [Lactuca saligna]